MVQLVFKRRATRALARMAAGDRQRILDALANLARAPHAVNPSSKRLEGRDGFRLRVADWRVLYALEDDRLIILVLQIGSREDVHK